MSVAIFISDKINLKSKTVMRQNGHYMMIKRLIHQENVMIINIYSCKIRMPKCIKQILVDLNGEVDNNAVIVRDFNTPHSAMGRSYRQEIIKEIRHDHTVN